MKNVEELLKNFLELLKKENRLLIESLRSKEASEELLETIKNKEQVLSEILSLEKKDVEPFEKLLIDIENFTQRNKILANGNIEFINEVFEAIFEENSTKQYTKDGSLETKRETILNKKA